MNARDILRIHAASLALILTTAQANGSETHAPALETYKIDSSHSAITFKVRHFFTQVPGSFANFQGTIKLDKTNPANNSAEAVIQVASVDTNDAKRDSHLKTEDFFEATAFPAMTFESTRWEALGGNKHRVTGNLTIKETTKEVVLDVLMLGSGEKRGKHLTGWQATTTLDRTDFGVSYGRGVVGADVAVEINVEAVRQGG